MDWDNCDGCPNPSFPLGLAAVVAGWTQLAGLLWVGSLLKFCGKRFCVALF